MPDINPKLSVIVPAYNSAQTLAMCLDALIRACRQCPDVEILVVDDASTDETAAIASRYDVRLFKIQNNSGPAVARNLGAAKAHGGILVFVDADVAVAEDALKRIAEYFNTKSGTALIGSYDNSPIEQNLISRYRNLLHHFVHQHAPEYATHFWTGLGAVGKSVFDSQGGFNEQDYGRCCEDIELGYRLRAAGYAIAIDKALQGKHLKHWTLASMVRTDLLIRAIPWTQLLLQYRHLPNDFSLGWAQRLSVALAWLCLLSVSVIASLPPAPLAVAFLFVGVNWPFFKFLAAKGGWLMSAACVPPHLLYQFNAGLGFLIGLCIYSFSNKMQPLS